MSYMMRPPIVLLKEGTDSSQGIPQLISNINACGAVCQILKTTLGPRGMDKLIHSDKGVTISNDGATIIKLLDIVHPAASTLADIAKSQDAEVGDGTTSVVLLAGELLGGVKGFIEDGMHPQIIIKGFRMAHEAIVTRMREIRVEVGREADPEGHRDMLLKCAGTALNSKLICANREFFADIVVRAVLALDKDLDIKMIGIKKVPGGSVTESMLVEGVAFEKTFSYAGFEQQPKAFKNAKVALLNVELERKAERSNAEIRLTDPDEYQRVVDAEWKIIFDKLEKIVASGAKIVLSKLPIGDLATQYFADREVFCAGRVTRDDMDRVARATGAVIQTSLNDLSEAVLGTVGNFEERQLGPVRYNVFTGCPQAKTATIILRGGAEQFIAETERSIHDAIMVVKRATAHSAVVGGGGAIEMELSRHLREYSKTIKDKTQLVIAAYAKALEVIPRQLAQNAGFDSTNIVNDLRAHHARGDLWAGVDIENEGVCDTMQRFVWEPALLKQNALSAATQAACMILSVDETVRNPRSQAHNDDRAAPAPNRGRRRKN